MKWFFLWISVTHDVKQKKYKIRFNTVPKYNERDTKIKSAIPSHPLLTKRPIKCMQSINMLSQLNLLCEGLNTRSKYYFKYLVGETN